MADMTLAQAMEFYANPQTRDLVQMLLAGHILAAEVRRRDAMVCETCRRFDGTYWCKRLDHNVWLMGNGCRAWQQREGE